MPFRGAALVLLASALSLTAACGGQSDEAVVPIDLGPAIRDLGSDDLEVSERARSLLLAVGSPAVPALAAALRRQPEEVRVGVIEVLAEVPGDEAAGLLLDALADQSAEVRGDAAVALGDRQGSAVEAALTQALRDPDPRVRQGAALACRSACRSGAAVPALVDRALDDADGSVGWTAAGTLSDLRGGADEGLRRTVDAAVLAAAPARLTEPDTARRTRAAILLASMSDDRAVPVLEALVGKPGDALTRWRIIHALGRLGGPSAVGRLRGLLAEPSLAAYTYDALRRAADRGVPGAADALAGYEGPRPAGPLPPPPS